MANPKKKRGEVEYLVSEEDTPNGKKKIFLLRNKEEVGITVKVVNEVIEAGKVKSKKSKSTYFPNERITSRWVDGKVIHEPTGDILWHGQL